MTYKLFQEEILIDLHFGFLIQVIGICLRKQNSENKVGNSVIYALQAVLPISATAKCFMYLSPQDIMHKFYNGNKSR